MMKQKGYFKVLVIEGFDPRNASPATATAPTAAETATAVEYVREILAKPSKRVELRSQQSLPSSLPSRACQGGS